MKILINKDKTNFPMISQALAFNHVQHTLIHKKHETLTSSSCHILSPYHYIIAIHLPIYGVDLGTYSFFMLFISAFI